MGNHAQEAAPGPSWRVELAVVAGLLVAFVALLLPTLDHPLLERHDFRQTQTAFTARIFHEEGIDLLHPRVPVLGAPFEIPFEFPLYQAAASLMMDLGVAEDTAMRVTTLFCFLATALLLYGLVRYIAGRTAAIGSLVAFVVTPLAVVWSRASTIEYLAAACAVGFTWAFIVWRDRRQPIVGVLCLLAGLVAILVKPTTAVFWLIPAVAYRPTGPNRIAMRRDPWSAALLVIPLVAATAWTLHADAIKKSTATTRVLTSSGLRDWNFGTPGNRVDPDIWNQIGKAYAELLVSPPGLVLLVAAALALVRGRVDQRWFWIAIACAAFLPPAVFTNLFFIHEYYLAAVAPAGAALIGLGVSYTATVLRRPRARLAAAAVGAILFSIWLASGYRYWHSAYRGNATHEATVLGLADEVARVTSPSDLVAVQGLDWNPSLLYYARRRGLMVVAKNEPFGWDLIDAGPFAHLFVYEPDKTDLGFTSRWSWIGALGEHTYAIGDDPGDVSAAHLVTTDRGAHVDAHLARAPSIGSPRTIDCASPTRLPAAASQGTWLELKDPPRSARIAVPSLAPLPARELVFVAPELADDGSITISCGGVDRLRVAAVRDAPALG